MAKYRRKPNIVEAIRLDDTSYGVREVLLFMGQEVTNANLMESDRFEDYVSSVRIEGLRITTLEGVVTARVGDYIIKGIKGEFYPCKPDIFEANHTKL